MIARAVHDMVGGVRFFGWFVTSRLAKFKRRRAYRTRGKPNAFEQIGARPYTYLAVGLTLIAVGVWAGVQWRWPRVFVHPFVSLGSFLAFMAGLVLVGRVAERKLAAEREAALRVDCPTCNAVPGQPCSTRSAMLLKEPHRRRVRVSVS